MLLVFELGLPELHCCIAVRASEGDRTMRWPIEREVRLRERESQFVGTLRRSIARVCKVASLDELVSDGESPSRSVDGIVR